MTPSAEIPAVQAAVPEWVADFLNRRVTAEQELLDIAGERKYLPTRERCRELALKLGVLSAFGVPCN